MKNYTINNLMDESIRMSAGTVVVWPQYSEEETLNLTEIARTFNDCYATNNSTVCFVKGDCVFVTPYTTAVMRCLAENGFREEIFYVPFSNGDYPKAESLKWFALREKAKKSYEEDFVETCKSYCEAHGIGNISDRALSNCVVMPAAGVKVKHLGWGESIEYPAITCTSFDCTVPSYLGKYCTNNGRLVFVYRDGKTYVTKDFDIINELYLAGFSEGSLFVPFSNGEEIMDFDVRARWDAIKEN